MLTLNKENRRMGKFFFLCWKVVREIIILYLFYQVTPKKKKVSKENSFFIDYMNLILRPPPQKKF